MKQVLTSLFAVPLLIGSFAGVANAATVTRTVTTTSSDCRDFTRTTTYVNRTVSTQGTACLYPDGAWHDVTSPGEPIVQYEAPVVVERPVVYTEPQYIPVPVYGYGYYDHPHHYDGGYYRGGGYRGGGYRGGGYGRNDVGYDLNIRGRL